MDTQMKNIAAAFVKAQKNKTPEGRMMEARLLREALPPPQGFNQFTGGTPLERMMRHVIFGASECWHWRGSIDTLGYGRTRMLGENRAHRASWRIFKGDIPDGMKVMHKCDTRCCVNPDHLMLGTQLENIRDMLNKGRFVAGKCDGEANPMARLTRNSVEEIRRLKQAGTKQIEIARMFGVSPMTISRAVRMESWK